MARRLNGQQFAKTQRDIEVYHGTPSMDAPHERPHPSWGANERHVKDQREYTETRLASDDRGDGWSDRAWGDEVIFTGTREAAQTRLPSNRPGYLHKYIIPAHAISPVVYGDDDMDDPELGGGPAPEVKQPGLWESLPLRRREVAKEGRVFQMRNSIEDAGSISHVIPKAKMGELGVRYAGREEVTPHRIV
jgi:hypothetical protein